jgi:2-polyprenyl-3-methyl-5-hydroxy-6-metoxy-1,4-benzoquinol methylase
MNCSFDQYDQRGAYHWDVLRCPPRRIGGYPARLAARYRLVLRQLPDGNHQQVLDIGCGDGALTYQMAQRGHHVIGLDPELDGVRLAVRFTREQHCHPMLSFVVGSAYALPYESQAADVVVMADVIEHLEHPHLTLSEACRVLKPAGRLIVSTPQRWPGKPLWRYHFREFTAAELTDLLSHSFVNVQVVCSEPLVWYKLHRSRLLGHRVFGFTINVLSALGLNPFLLRSRRPSLRYGQLTAVAWKGSPA